MSKETKPNVDLGLVVSLASKISPFQTGEQRDNFFADAYNIVQLSSALSFARNYTAGVIHSNVELYNDCTQIVEHELKKFLDYANPEGGSILDGEFHNETQLSMLGTGHIVGSSRTWNLAYVMARGLNGSPGNVVANFIDDERNYERVVQRIANFYMDIAEDAGIHLVRKHLNQEFLYNLERNIKK